MVQEQVLLSTDAQEMRQKSSDHNIARGQEAVQSMLQAEASLEVARQSLVAQGQR